VLLLALNAPYDGVLKILQNLVFVYFNISTVKETFKAAGAAVAIRASMLNRISGGDFVLGYY
jgi:hypothetical protein